jgi:nitroimidazol reductase NimA-like FMN-containing flavoprotein (pyridoxamine 5'-phosphate oxidase superfamily)
MRRKDKEIHQPELIDTIIASARVCRLGMCRDNQPYIIPVSFGYDGAAIYFHTASEGQKIDFLNANSRVCFELEHEVEILPHESEACKWSCSFYSVIGFGNVEEICTARDKVRAMHLIMKHYSDRKWHFDEQQLGITRLWRISIEHISGKCSGDKFTLNHA